MNIDSAELLRVLTPQKCSKLESTRLFELKMATDLSYVQVGLVNLVYTIAN